MVDNDDYHFKFFRSCHNESSVDAKHTDNELRVVKEKVRNYGKCLKHKSNKQVFADLLIQGLSPSVFGEHTVDMGYMI